MATNVVRILLSATTVLALVFAGCKDDPKSRFGDPCGADNDCQTGFCLEGRCLMPYDDEDGDTLANLLEREIGTNPFAADTDEDGEPDGQEVVQDTAPVDTDGDGLIDAVESQLPEADEDSDCLPDEFDPENAVADPDNDRLVYVWCLKKGVCGEDVNNVIAVCDSALAGSEDAVECDYGRIATYEEVESRCDELDNDCDGNTDEELTAVDDPGTRCPRVGVCEGFAGTVLASCEEGSWTCDFPGLEGYEQGDELTCDELDNDCDGETDEAIELVQAGIILALGDACGLGACTGGEVVCAGDGSGAVCSTSETASEEVCDREDNDCDGHTDEGYEIDGMAVGQPCNGTGACATARGVVECMDTETSVCSVDAGGSNPAGSAEICDGEDDDCDGVTDEEPTVPGGDPVCPEIGVCLGQTFVYCNENLEPVCDFMGVPDFEAEEVTCDELDNDCDVWLDEGMPKTFQAVLQKLWNGVPQDRSYAASALLPGQNRMVLFGGLAVAVLPTASVGAGALADTWEFDVNTDTWSRVDTAPVPPARFGARLVHDAKANRLLLVGGYLPAAGKSIGFLPGQPRTDLWAYDLATRTWTDITPEQGMPTAGVWPTALVADGGERHDLWIVGGVSRDAEGGFAFQLDLDDGTETFHTPEQMTGVVFSDAACGYLPSLDTIVVFGGMDDMGGLSGTTWLIDLSSGTPVATSLASGLEGWPGPQTGAAMAASPDSPNAYLFGYRVSDGMAATWRLSVAGASSTWAPFAQPSEEQPPVRMHAAAALAGGRLHLRLGTGTRGHLKHDAWSAGLASYRWVEEASPLAAPPARFGAVSAFDPAETAWYIYGGASATSQSIAPFFDLWRFDLQTDTWERLDAPGGPPAIFSAGALDPDGRALYVFGGADDDASLTDVLIEPGSMAQAWRLDLDTLSWAAVQRGGDNIPVARVGATAALVPGTDEILVVGGLAGGSPDSDRWLYDISEDAWTALSASGDQALPRAMHAVLVDGTRAKMFLLGGYGSQGGMAIFDYAENVWSEVSSVLPEATVATLAGYDEVSEEALILSASQTRFAQQAAVVDLAVPATPATTVLSELATTPAGVLFGAPVYDPVRRGLLVLSAPTVVGTGAGSVWRVPQVCP